MRRWKSGLDEALEINDVHVTRETWNPKANWPEMRQILRDMVQGREMGDISEWSRLSSRRIADLRSQTSQRGLCWISRDVCVGCVCENRYDLHEFACVVEGGCFIVDRFLVAWLSSMRRSQSGAVRSEVSLTLVRKFFKLLVSGFISICGQLSTFPGREGRRRDRTGKRNSRKD